jgi:hypothetical protein
MSAGEHVAARYAIVEMTLDPLSALYCGFNWRARVRELSKVQILDPATG